MMSAQDQMCNFRSSLKLLCVRFHGAHLGTAHHQDLERNLTQAQRRTYFHAENNSSACLRRQDRHGRNVAYEKAITGFIFFFSY